MNTGMKRWRHDMTNMASIAKSLKELAEFVKSIQNSMVKVSGDTESK